MTRYYEPIKFMGYVLEQDVDEEEDNVKIFHSIIEPNGKQHFLAVSPYRSMGYDDLVNFVEFYLNRGRFPNRKEIKRDGPGPIQLEPNDDPLAEAKYPKYLTKTIVDPDDGTSNAASNRQARKEIRKKIKAKQHAALMKGLPKIQENAMDKDLQELLRLAGMYHKPQVYEAPEKEVNIDGEDSPLSNVTNTVAKIRGEKPTDPTKFVNADGQKSILSEDDEWNFALEKAQDMIDADDDLVYDVAAEYGAITANVKHMGWFVNEVAKRIVDREAANDGMEAHDDFEDAGWENDLDNLDNSLNRTSHSVEDDTIDFNGYEDIAEEPLDELKKTTLGSYAKKSFDSYANTTAEMDDNPDLMNNSAKFRNDKTRQLINRDKGIKRAIARLVKEEDDDEEFPTRARRFADPGGNSSLYAAGERNPRIYACPTCDREQTMTQRDLDAGYQCNRCADAAEGIGMGYYEENIEEAEVEEDFLAPPKQIDPHTNEQETWNDAEDTADERAKFMFDNERAYYLVCHELGDSVDFGSDDEILVPTQLVGRIESMLIDAGFNEGEDYMIDEDTVAEDLGNGYDEHHAADGDDYFPSGATSNASKRGGPAAAKHGNNPMSQSMYTENKLYETYKREYSRFRAK